jgi:hypothetical protein
MTARYPGAQPFQDDQLSRRLFFGRDSEATALTNQILAHRLVVVFARSGLGKTSLLNAGVAERLRIKGHFPVVVRLNDIKRDPIACVYGGVSSGALARSDIEYESGSETSLCFFFKTIRIWRGFELLFPVIILDQFEELFTLQLERKRTEFTNQLSYLVRGVRPSNVKVDDPGTGDNMGPVSDTPPQVRVVISLREDFLPELEQLSDSIPEILDQRFRLAPLSRLAASQALKVPAGVEDSGLTTRPFTLQSNTSEQILTFLEQHSELNHRKQVKTIEPFQLQLICQVLEKEALIRQANKEGEIELSLSDIGGERRLSAVLQDFYKEQLAPLSWIDRVKARRLCSEFLISREGRRLRLEETEALDRSGISATALEKLISARLLRMDKTDNGNYIELSHDSLVKPIANSQRTQFIVEATMWPTIGAIAVVLIIFPFANRYLHIFADPPPPPPLGQNPLLHAMFYIFTVVFGMITVLWSYDKFKKAREFLRRAQI